MSEIATPKKHTAKKPRRIGFSHLTSKQKIELMELYKSGEWTIHGLAKKFSCAISTVTRILKINGVKKGESAAVIAAKAREAIERRQAEDATVLAERVSDTRNNAYKIMSVLEKLIAQEITSAKTTGAPISSVQKNIVTLKIATDAVSNSWRTRKEILGLDKELAEEHNLPSLTIRELTKEQIDQMQEQQIQDDIEQELLGLEQAIATEEKAAMNMSGAAPNESPSDSDDSDGVKTT